MIHFGESFRTHMVEVILLGIAQDGGRPQAGCNKSCCTGLSADQTSYPTSLGIISPSEVHLIDVTRNLASQLQFMDGKLPTHVWLTHAHFGHVDGLGQFGRETINAKDLKLHISKSMHMLLNNTPQWKLMLDQGVFSVNEIVSKTALTQEGFSITPILVPHRAELSDMHAFVIRGPNKALLYLPDHDTWQETLELHQCNDLREWFIQLKIDIALIDGTFWSGDELSGRNQDKVPHPPITQTLDMLGFKRQGDPDIIFIHLNHTNPVYDQWGEEHTQVVEMGWKIGKQGMEFEL